MRIAQAIFLVFASLLLVDAAALREFTPASRNSVNRLDKRQVVGANICATVGPLAIPNILPILPQITIISVCFTCQV
jgi:hypothetical protein